MAMAMLMGTATAKTLVMITAMAEIVVTTMAMAMKLAMVVVAMGVVTENQTQSQRSQAPEVHLNPNFQLKPKQAAVPEVRCHPLGDDFGRYSGLCISWEQNSAILAYDLELSSDPGTTACSFE